MTPLETLSDNFVRAARLDDVRAAGRTSVRVAGHSLALFLHDGRVHALDNRCPHMGFPLHRGTLQDGIQRFPRLQRRSRPRGPTSSQKEYYVTIKREGSEGGGLGRLDRRRAPHVRDGRVDPAWPQPGGDRRRTPPGSGGLPPGALVVGLLGGAEATRFGVEAILWAALGAFAVLAIYRLGASLRAR